MKLSEAVQIIEWAQKNMELYDIWHCQDMWSGLMNHVVVPNCPQHENFLRTYMALIMCVRGEPDTNMHVVHTGANEK